MLRFTDVAWMDDRTAPSVHVRHNIQGLSAVFPPAYLLSFVTDHDTEPLHDAPDLSLYFRSRMGGALGLCFRGDSFTEDENASMAREIAIYKAARATIALSAGSLLTRQAAPEDGPSWDVLQESTAGRDSVVLSAVQSDTGVQTINVKPTKSGAGHDLSGGVGRYRAPRHCHRPGAHDARHRRRPVASVGRAHADHHGASNEPDWRACRGLEPSSWTSDGPDPDRPPRIIRPPGEAATRSPILGGGQQQSHA